MKRAARTFEAQQLPERVDRVIYVLRNDHPMILLEGDFPCMGCGMPVTRGAHRPKDLLDYGKYAVAWYSPRTHRRSGASVCAWRFARECIRVVIQNLKRS
jgi:hypothetical protein